MLNLTTLGHTLTAGRQRNEELSPAARAAICGALAAGASQRVVATAFGVSRSVIQDTLERFATTESFESKKRAGRPKALSRQERRYLAQLAKRDPRLTRTQLRKAIGLTVSDSTVR